MKEKILEMLSEILNDAGDIRDRSGEYISDRLQKLEELIEQLKNEN